MTRYYTPPESVKAFALSHPDMSLAEALFYVLNNRSVTQ